MPKLWLTYAWTDNQDNDVDFVAQELERRGLQVNFDRVHLVAGQRLWSQIDRGISDPQLSDAWAIFVTANSLKSEPCQEELAIALDRALRKRGGQYPLIGIFPTDVDRELVPSAIAVRLWVHLQDPTWADQIVSSLTNGARTSPSEVAPFHLKKHVDRNGNIWAELRPRSGTWYPAIVLVPENERSILGAALPGAPGHIPSGGMVHEQDISGGSGDGRFSGRSIHHRIDNQGSLFVHLKGVPSKLVFGSSQANYIVDDLRSFGF